MKLVRIVSLLLLGSSVPTASAQDAARIWQHALDLRTLPADSRPAEIAVTLSATAVPAPSPPLLASVAINGLVLGRHRLEAGRTIRFSHALQDRLLSVRNRVEVAVSTPGCSSAACAAAVAKAKLVDRPRFRLAAPEGAPGDFSQLVTRLRAGVATQDLTPTTAPLARAVRAALAPAAAVSASAPATILISRDPPGDVRAPLRFDLGPVELRRSDGARLLAAEDLNRMTVVQVLRFGERPLIWVRPGDHIPDRLELDSGDIAILDGNRRLIAWSTRRDPAVQIRYAPGVDPTGEERRTTIWRIVLLLIWLIASVLLLRLWRRLPVPGRAKAVAS